MYNFGNVSEKAPTVFGVEAPGVPMKPGGKYNDPGSVPNSVVEDWAVFLKENGVTRTLCLLKQEELGGGWGRMNTNQCDQVVSIHQT